MSQVVVNCTLRQGLQLRLYRDHEGVNTATVPLRFGANLVEDSFMRAWWQENQDSPFVRNGTISVAAATEPEGPVGEDVIAERPEVESSVDAPAPETESST